eukprot:Em0009g1011a
MNAKAHNSVRGGTRSKSTGAPLRVRHIGNPSFRLRTSRNCAELLQVRRRGGSLPVSTEHRLQEGASKWIYTVPLVFPSAKESKLPVDVKRVTTATKAVLSFTQPDGKANAHSESQRRQCSSRCVSRYCFGRAQLRLLRAPPPSLPRQHHESGGSSASLADEKSKGQLQQPASTPATSTRFLVEFLSGALPIHRPHCTDTTILLDNKSKFEKVLQEKFPQEPHEWCSDTCAVPCVARKYTRGFNAGPVCHNLPRTQRSSNGHVSHLMTSASPPQTILHSQWFQPKDRSISELWHVLLNSLDLSEVVCMRNLLSLSNADQVCGIMASVMMARATPTAPPQEETALAIGRRTMQELCRLLLSDTERVRVCAALALYYAWTCTLKSGLHLDMPSNVLPFFSPQAEQVLLDALSSQSQPECWAAVQCLALGGVCHDSVIRSLVSTLVEEGGDSSRTDKAIDLLAALSWRTPLVAAEVSVLLNSEGWRGRVTGCLVVGRLHQLSRDLAHRLSFLMWEDANREVRLAAAQALGKAGEAKIICDEIERQLRTGSSTRRLAAIKMLRSLKLMTPQLLPAYLLCFKDDHVSVKIEAIMIAGTLRLSGAQVLPTLINLISDPCWRVKAHTLRANLPCLSYNLGHLLETQRIPVPSPMTVHLDASDNNLTDLPIGASNYWMHTLERLYLSKNQLKEISRSITELSHITVLDLSSNQIQTLPPTNLDGNQTEQTEPIANQLVLLTHKPDSSAPSPPQRISIIERLTGKVNTVAPPLTSVMDDIPRDSQWSFGLAVCSPCFCRATKSSSFQTTLVASQAWHVLTSVGSDGGCLQYMDLAGQEVYYATHQCFLSRNTLYLVVWNMEEGDKGIEYLQPWLLNIQSRAPHSPVSDHSWDTLRQASPRQGKDLREHYKQKIHSIYGQTMPSFSMTTGVLLHYNDHLRGLNNLYFIDPIWLATCLLRDSKRFPSQFFQQYLQLLERFEIALSLGNGQRLIPSMYQSKGRSLVLWSPNRFQSVSIGRMFEASAILVGDGIDGTQPKPVAWTSRVVGQRRLSAMGYVVDQLDSLIDEWFPRCERMGWEEAYGWDGGGGTKLSLEGACVLYLGLEKISIDLKNCKRNEASTVQTDGRGQDKPGWEGPRDLGAGGGVKRPGAGGGAKRPGGLEEGPRDLRSFLAAVAPPSQVTTWIARHSQPASGCLLFAFEYTHAIKEASKGESYGKVDVSPAPTFLNPHDWEKELSRLGITGDQWRVTEANKRFSICASLSPYFVCPTNITDTTLEYAATLHAQNRLPVWCWSHPQTGVNLTRASVSVAQEQDEAPDPGLMYAITMARQIEKQVEARRIERFHINSHCGSLRDVAKAFSKLQELCMPCIALFSATCRLKVQKIQWSLQPVFLLFLDCVVQLSKQFPSAFEFSETYILCLYDLTNSCLYGNFLFDSVKERVAASNQARTNSVSGDDSLDTVDEFEGPLLSAWNNWRAELNKEDNECLLNPFYYIFGSSDAPYDCKTAGLPFESARFNCAFDTAVPDPAIGGNFGLYSKNPVACRVPPLRTSASEHVLLPDTSHCRMQVWAGFFFRYIPGLYREAEQRVLQEHYSRMVREVRKLKDLLNGREMEAGARESDVKRMSDTSVASSDDLSTTTSRHVTSVNQEHEVAVDAPTFSDKSKSLPTGSIAHFSNILKNTEERVTGRSPRTRSTHSPGPSTGRSPISKTKLKVTRNQASEPQAAAMIWRSSKPNSASEGSGSPPRSSRKLVLRTAPTERWVIVGQCSLCRRDGKAGGSEVVVFLGTVRENNFGSRVAKFIVGKLEAKGHSVTLLEYNHSLPPALTNLMDHFYSYKHRPSGIVCYSAGPYAGVRSAMQARAFLGELSTPSVGTIFSIPVVYKALTPEGEPSNKEDTSLNSGADN